MPAVTRDVSIAYAGVTFGGSSEILLHGPWSVEGSYETTLVRFTVLVQRDTESAFDSDCDSVEAALRKPNQALTITIGSTAFFSLSHSGNTGYLARASFKIRDDETNTSRSRIYEATVALRNPANLTGKNGLRIASIGVMKTPAGRRALQVRGSYTALSSNSAVAQYEASVTALVDGIVTDLTGTWEATQLAYERDDENKELTFVATRKEIIAAQSGSATDHAALKDVRIAITRTRLGPGDANASARRMVELAIFFDAWVDKDQTTDLLGLYEGTIRPFLLTRARSAAGATTIALVRDAPVLDEQENRISATIEVIAATTNLLMFLRTVEDQTFYGWELVPVWDGNPKSKAKFRGPMRVLRVITEESMTLGASGGSGGGGGGNGFAGTPFGFAGHIDLVAGGNGGNGNYLGGVSVSEGGGGGQDGWTVLMETKRPSTVTIGLQEAQFDVTRVVKTTVMEYADTPGRGGSGGSSGGGGGGFITGGRIS